MMSILTIKTFVANKKTRIFSFSTHIFQIEWGCANYVMHIHTLFYRSVNQNEDP